jgi:excisionase family DNA binding protein
MRLAATRVERLVPPAFDGLVSVKQVTVLLQIPVRRVYELASRRELKVVRIGRSLRCQRSDIDAYIENHVEQPFPQLRSRHRFQ